MSIDRKKVQIKDLLNRANFLKNSIDEDILVIKIERELAKITKFIVEARSIPNNVITWHYAIAGYNKWEWNNQNRLQSLLDQMKYFNI